MARLNIEESIWTDLRFEELSRLCGGKEEAMGSLVFAWRHAQGYHQKGGRIPSKLFKLLHRSSEMLDVDLAHDDGEFVTMRGQEACFAWLANARDAGKRGGIASAASRRNIIEKKSKRPLSDPQATLKQNEPSYSYSSSSSSSYSNTKHNNAQSAIERVYLECFPRKTGKTRGIKVLLRDKNILDKIGDLRKAALNYADSVAGKDPQYMKHFSTWACEWEDWIDWKEQERKSYVASVYEIESARASK